MNKVKGGPGSQSDVNAAVWKLVDGFSILVRISRTSDEGHIFKLSQLCADLRNLALASEREQLADHLDAAKSVLERRIT